MADNPEPNVQRFTYQSAHLRLDWLSCCKESSLWDDVRYYQPKSAVVQIKGRARRLYADESCLLVVERS